MLSDSSLKLFARLLTLLSLKPTDQEQRGMFVAAAQAQDELAAIFQAKLQPKEPPKVEEPCPPKP